MDKISKQIHGGLLRVGPGCQFKGFSRPLESCGYALHDPAPALLEQNEAITLLDECLQPAPRQPAALGIKIVNGYPLRISPIMDEP